MKFYMCLRCFFLFFKIGPKMADSALSWHCLDAEEWTNALHGNLICCTRLSCGKHGLYDSSLFGPTMHVCLHSSIDIPCKTSSREGSILKCSVWSQCSWAPS